ncbi:hypothetical protein PV326_001290 [Microctonus aethiopoides]|nr:hypothetical protein PV326_001290 [Microctonus aethiopoides]
MEFYADVHLNYNGFVTTKNNITAFLIIDNLHKLYWFKRIRIEDDQRPHTVNYYPRLAPMHLENQWPFNNNDDDDDDITDEVSTDTDTESQDNYIDHEMHDFLIQNWIAADGDESGYITYEEDDEEDDDVSNHNI